MTVLSFWGYGFLLLVLFIEYLQINFVVTIDITTTVWYYIVVTKEVTTKFIITLWRYSL